MRKSYGIGIATAIMVGLATLTAQAAPIGVPAAMTGAGKTTVGVEVNIMADRDLTGGVSTAESSQVFAKGAIGVDNRLDLVFRLGFADFRVDQPGTDIDTDIGPAFGIGLKTTWATIPRSHLKIGSVFQTTRVRAEDHSIRFGFSEYDAALGIALDLAAHGAARRNASQISLIPYGGFAWSGLDIDGSAAEDDSFGLFLGLQAATDSPVGFGVEVRLIDQTAISLNAGMAF